jgi:hypothetical protein
LDSEHVREDAEEERRKSKEPAKPEQRPLF